MPAQVPRNDRSCSKLEVNRLELKQLNTTVKQKIELLAQEHGVVYHQTYFDELADTYARLSDSDVELDETELLLLELDRAGILTGEANGLLHLQYLGERKT